MIKELQHLVPENSMNIGGYTHIKIKIRIAFNKRDFTICQNIETSRILILYIFLINFFNIDIIKISKPAKIAGYLGLIIKF